MKKSADKLTLQGTSLLHQFLQFIKKEELFPLKNHLLLAVSGGVDSVVLCELCKQAEFHFSIAHCNFQLRGEESNKDEQSVREMGDRYNVQVFVKDFDTNAYANDHNLSIQVAARELRYAWFQSILENDKNSIHAVLTAHHADDNIETVLMNFFKGTGMAGLRGILPKQGNIIRPLLFARKSLLYAFADHYQLSFREDSSNASDKYTRNYFRHHLLPVVQKVFAQAEENLAKNIVRFREAEQLYFQAIDQHKKKLMEKRGHEMFIPVLKLKKTKPLETVTYEIIKEFGFSARQSQEVIGLLDSETSKYVQSSLFRIIKSRNWLIISPIKTELSQTIVIEGSAGKFPFENGTLELKEQPVINFQPSSLPLTAQLDALSISFPLILRKRKQGDYFYPLGMKKKKKLNRFMSDNKISVTEKENTWVLEMNKKIIWVVGHRIDDRFKITGNTSKMLQVKFIPTGS